VELWRRAIRHGDAVGATQRPLPAIRDIDDDDDDDAVINCFADGD